MDERICPECGAEYLPHVTECPACEVPTRSALDPPPPRAVAGQALALPEGVEAVGLRSAPLPWAQELADLLADHGVPSRIARLEACGTGGSCSDRYTVFVRPEDLQQAVQVDHDHLSRQVPESFTDLAQVPGDRCPACGAAVGEGDGECPDCGLVLAPAAGAGQEAQEG